MMKNKLFFYVSRKVHFSSGHRYFNAKFSEEENKKIFGTCYSPYGHGHNYILEAHIKGPIDKETGMVIHLSELDQILKEVITPLDHHHLNFDIDFFKKNVPTTENIAFYLFERIKKRIKKPRSLHKVRVFEGDDLWADCIGE